MRFGITCTATNSDYNTCYVSIGNHTNLSAIQELEKHFESTDLCQGSSFPPFSTLFTVQSCYYGYQNLIYSLAHFQPSLKISCKSVHNFLCKVANKQTNRQTNQCRQKHNLLGRGNNCTNNSQVIAQGKAKCNFDCYVYNYSLIFIMDTLI